MLLLQPVLLLLLRTFPVNVCTMMSGLPAFVMKPPPTAVMDSGSCADAMSCAWPLGSTSHTSRLPSSRPMTMSAHPVCGGTRHRLDRSAVKT